MKNLFHSLLGVLIVVLLSCTGGKKEASNEKLLSDTARETIESLTEKIKDAPSNAQLYGQRAKAFLMDQQIDKAINDASKAISLDPKNPEYQIVLSDIYLLSGKTQECESTLNRILELDPKNKAAILRLAKMHLVVRNYPGTFADIKRALEMDPINPEAYFTRSIALLEKGDTLHALDDLRKAVEQDQNYFEAYLELGELYSLKRDRLAADYFKNALNIRPNSVEARYMLGMFYQETDQYDKAIETYSILAKADTTFKSAPFNIGYIYLVYLNDFKKAIIYFTDAIKRDPGYIEAWFNRAYSNELAGNYTDAYSDYKMVLKLKTNDEKAIEGLNRLDKIKFKR